MARRKLRLDFKDPDEARAVIRALSTYGRVIANTDSAAQTVQRCDEVRHRLEETLDAHTDGGKESPPR